MKIKLCLAVLVSFHEPQLLPSPDGPTGSQYEKPTGGGKFLTLGRWSPFSIGKKSEHNSNWQALNFWIAGFPLMGEVKFHLLFRDAGYSFSERSPTLFTIIMLLTKNIF